MLVHPGSGRVRQVADLHLRPVVQYQVMAGLDPGRSEGATHQCVDELFGELRERIPVRGRQPKGRQERLPRRRAGPASLSYDGWFTRALAVVGGIR
jgi:hypothetical protein